MAAGQGLAEKLRPGARVSHRCPMGNRHQNNTSRTRCCKASRRPRLSRNPFAMQVVSPYLWDNGHCRRCRPGGLLLRSHLAMREAQEKTWRHLGLRDSRLASRGKGVGAWRRRRHDRDSFRRAQGRGGRARLASGSWVGFGQKKERDSGSGGGEQRERERGIANGYEKEGWSAGS